MTTLGIISIRIRNRSRVGTLWQVELGIPRVELAGSDTIFDGEIQSTRGILTTSGRPDVIKELKFTNPSSPEYNFSVVYSKERA